MKRAFLGGSFDPVHLGHTAMARHLLDTGMADVVHVIPTWLSPHKNAVFVSATHRLAMVRLAFAAECGVVIETREIDGRTSCFTVDTLAALQVEHGEAEWLLVIGGDNLGSFDKWRHPLRLQKMAEIVVMGRDNQDLSAAAIEQVGLNPGLVNCIPDFDHTVSSTSVRAKVSGGERSVLQFEAAGVSKPVAEYILAHHLYPPNWNGEKLVPDSD